MKNVVLNGKVVHPSKIICIGRNYVDHIAELGNEIPDEMVVFNKPNSAISTQLSSFHQEPLHYEAELCFLFQQGKFTAVAFGLDLTKRGLQSKLKVKGLPWERAKSFNGAAIFSEFVAIDIIEDELSLELKINNEVAQFGGVALMMFKPEQILAELESFIGLEDGDIVMTGTPKGVGLINKGDEFTGRVLLRDKELLTSSWQAQ
jgi:2-keto-4-pentenoate hydratase/2-oxohepta-3-ene-1,7-dioic acid hydratase in catechol pathway